MWYSKLFFIVCCLLTATQLQAAKKVTPKGETKVVNGVSIQATWYSDDIVRIVKYPGMGAAPEKKSYSVVLTPGRAANPNVQVRIDDATGLVTFLNNDGEVLLSETGAPMLDPRSDEVNKGKLRIAQRWQLQEDEDIYGLGQLRDEAMSWRGRDMELWNHNTYIAIP